MLGAIRPFFSNFLSGNPILFGSINDWKLVRMVDSRIFCQLLKYNQEEKLIRETTAQIKKTFPKTDEDKLRVQYYKTLE